MQRLHGSNDVHLGKAADLVRMNDLDVLDAMAAVAYAVDLPCMSVTVQRTSHGAVATA